MASKPLVLAMTPARFPGGAVDGSVAELHVAEDGTVTAEIRIPGPAVP